MEREKAAVLAGVQLDRIRTQQADQLNPLTMRLNTYLQSRQRMEQELSLTQDAFLVGLRTWMELPHCNGAITSGSTTDPRAAMAALGKRLIWKHQLEDVAALAEDSARCARYVETYQHVLVPRLREMAATFRANAHLFAPEISLVEHPILKIADICFGMPFAEYSQNLRLHAFNYVTFCESGCALVACSACRGSDILSAKYCAATCVF